MVLIPIIFIKNSEILKNYSRAAKKLKRQKVGGINGKIAQKLARKSEKYLVEVRSTRCEQFSML